MISMDKLCYNSKLRYENAGEKFAFAMITLAICVISRSALVAAVVLLTAGALTVIKGGVSALRYLKYLTVPLAFLFMSTAAVMFNLCKTPLDLFAIKIGGVYLTASTEGMAYSLQLILTALAAVSCLYFLSFTTPVPDILEVLKKLRTPSLLIELMLLIYRFIFVLMSTASAITVSQNCRLGNKNLKTALKSFGMMGSVLMIRAVSRSGKLYDSMEARCYDGEIKVLSETNPPRKKAVLGIVIFDSLLFLFALGEMFFR